MYDAKGKWVEAPYYAGLTDEQLLAEARVAMTQMREGMEVVETLVKRGAYASKKN